MMGKKNQLLKGADRHTIICTECTCPASIAVAVVMAVRPASQQLHTQSAMLPSRSTCEYPHSKLLHIASFSFLLAQVPPGWHLWPSGKKQRRILFSG